MAESTAINQINGLPPTIGTSKKEIWYHVLRDDKIFRDLLGEWGFTDCITLNKSDWSDSRLENDGTKQIEVETFRSISDPLPFAIKFTLELHIFNNTIIDITQATPPRNCTEEELEARKEEIAKPARRMLFEFIRQVVPTLLEMEWDVDVDNITMSELFAREVGASLATLKKAVANGKRPIEFDKTTVNEAMSAAYNKLKEAEDCIGTTEMNLASGHLNSLHIDIIRKRARWPYVEYSCRFFHGQLVPTEFEIINEPGAGLAAESRRGLREGGWFVRDRFCRVTNVFHSGDGLFDLIYSEPIVCGRNYQFLFDKGVGTSMKIWLLSKHVRGESKSRPGLEVTRDTFLGGLGWFEHVNETKLGDRIGLAFSQTIPIDELKQERVKVIPEISRNGYAFSDGCGVMGLNVALKIRKQMGLRDIPGAVQIRLGGVKGMLSLDTDFDSDSIGIRPSMIKFSSRHRVLEVKRVAGGFAKESPLIFTDKIFNQALLVLSHLGVPCKVFWDIQREACAGFALENDDTWEQYDELLCDSDNLDSYLNSVFQRGRKSNNVDRFDIDELTAIKESMAACKDKVNLPARVLVRFGIIDETNELEVGEVLVDNGSIVGDVLVFRSPCLFPGDIQRVRAVPRRNNSHANNSFFGNLLVFSSKGDRPLQDMLGGGDLDGDEYFVVYDQRIVEMVVTTSGHDYKTQNLGPPKPHPAIFTNNHGTSVSPGISKQLDVLKEFIEKGNLVVDTAEAWMRIADTKGVADPKCQEIAEMHQQALDSKNKAFSIDRHDFDYILKDWPRPHYRSGKKEGRRSPSLLGVIFELWGSYIKKIDLRIKALSSHVPEDEETRLDDEITVLLDDMSIMDKKFDAENSLINGELHRYCIVCKNPRAKVRCKICGFVWVCAGTCEIRHWRHCFMLCHTQDDLLEDESHTGEESILAKSHESTQDTASLSSFDAAFDFDLDMCGHQPQAESPDEIIESLVKIVFGQVETPRINDVISGINWSCIDDDAILALRQCVRVEFYEGFKRDLSMARAKARSARVDTPHIYDVFTMEPRLSCGNITLAVCMRSTAVGLLMWRDEDGQYHPLSPPFHKYRVASLSGPSRIIENMSLQSALTKAALKREPDSFVKAVDLNDVHIKCIPINIADRLNACQKRAVGTVISNKFNEGFFLVQGPPGSGKTVTLAAMIASLKEGLILASSNAAVANIAAKLLSVSGLSVKDVVVFGDNCNESVEFLSPSHRSRKFHLFKKEYDANQGNRSKQEELAKLFISWLRLDASSSIQDVVDHCPHINSDSKRGQHMSKLIGNAKAVLCTLNTAGSSFLRKAIDGKFDTLFLDEAAQCTEAEFYIATNFPGVKRIVLIGDPKQLNATVLHPTLKEIGYGNSFMKNVMECRQNVAHLLGIQYRCDPAIMRFSNQFYYENALITAKSACNRKPKVVHPLLFINTGNEPDQGNHGSEDSFGSSWRNPFEAQAVKRLLLGDRDVQAVLNEVQHATTMIITPYRAQVDLITQQLSRENMMTNIKIDTVDSFQGQEADVVIFSAVRTESEGFVNDEQRINVALTRAKRVLRIVGNIFFWSKTSYGSPMRRLAEHCESSGLVKSDEKLGKRAEALLKPSWNGIDKFTWKPTMVSKFHHSLKDLGKLDKNIALNTLLAVCMPYEKSLALQVNTKVPCWQQSALKGCEDRIQIIWVAKEDGAKPKIEAHFAGTRAKCNHFRQSHRLIPKGTVRIKQGLTGVNRDTLDEVNVNGQSENIDIAWTLKETLGNAILDGEIESLPDGYFDLDPEQTKICAQEPPLLIESGSGTGKTNVLFKHAVDYAYQVRSDQQTKSICFVTVSPRLKKELEKRYTDIALMERVSLPEVSFFSLRELLDGLLAMLGSDKSMKKICTFRQHIHSRSSFVDLSVDISEAENEISGVILGSLESALKKAPLLREEYIESKRSNIDISTQDGTDMRHLVYNEYQKYQKWKADGNRYDKDDLVLELIRSKKRLLSKRNPLFDSVYLDEIQDFTYASIYLICGIAGTPELRWICAGDTAQMISPGCSFKFDGLKQTMLAVHPGIESKIKSVVKLEKNYRVTKDVLVVSNSILAEAKKYFKGSIEYARPEKAVKDLGTRVFWCHWDEALLESPRFGANQALIYTSYDPESIFVEMNKWLNEHPFILTTLDSKGLEFEDVVVAFDLDRKAWAVKEKRVSSLRLLRELYVAVTRAKRRVVILIKRNVETMREFFLSLEGCNIVETDAKTAFLEFDSNTSSDEWFDLGMQRFEDENYKMAAACFKAAEKFSYFLWAQGKYELQQGDIIDGKESLRKAARAFFGDGSHERTLELLSAVMEIGWDSQDDYIYEESKMKCPSFFTPEQMIRFALSRDKWNEISIDNLKSRSTAFLFLDYRRNPQLVEKIALCSEKDREDIELSLPLVVGDYHMENNNVPKAVELYLDGADMIDAEKSTDCIIQMINSCEKTDLLLNVVEIWMGRRGTGASKASSNVRKDSDTFLLLHLFEATSKTSRPKVAFEKFGKDVVKAAFLKAGTSMEHLHEFDPSAFQTEIRLALEQKYENKTMEAIRWYLSRKDETNAADMAMGHMTELEADELLAVIRLNLPLKGVPKEAARRGVEFSTKLIRQCLENTNVTNVDLAIDVTNEAVSHKSLSVADLQKRVIIHQLIQVWQGDENYQNIKVKLSMNRRRQKPSRGMSFLRLLFEADECTTATKNTCMQVFGKEIVEQVVTHVFKDAKVRYSVLEKFDPNAFSHLRPKPKPTLKQNKNTNPSAQNPTPKPKFEANENITITGINSRPELNGQHGKILRFNDKSSRWEVKTENGAEISFKEENLQKYDNDSSNPPSLDTRARSASSSNDDNEESAVSSISSHDDDSDSEGSIPPLAKRIESSTDESSEDDNDSDGSMPNLTRRDGNSSDESGMPHINNRDVSSSSSNDSRDSRLF